MGMANFLTKEVAGQPVGVWGVVVVGGLGIAYYANRRQSASDEGREEPLTEPGVGTGLVPAGAAIVPGGDSSGDSGPRFENNSQWGQAALSFLIARGHNPSVADGAIRKYLVSEQLTAQEDAMIQEVLRSDVGVPPEDLAPAPSPGTGAPVGSPQVQRTSPWEIVLAKKAHTNITGFVTIGGERPTSPQTVTLEVFSPIIRTLIMSKQITQTDAQGNFSFRVGSFSTPSGKRLRNYRLTFKGSSTGGRIRITG